ncbi:hypothetical protein H5410_049594 [Solanum commersonii]|uniref:Uncharacterized protein n=1 Tax=Solanum commersonii TaxID=4109 RepID=A0A9J5WUJ0_SOLCO|nr:hypothetical protein H5410_049594 [Solanum commersonii]
MTKLTLNRLSDIYYKNFELTPSASSDFLSAPITSTNCEKFLFRSAPSSDKSYGCKDESFEDSEVSLALSSSSSSSLLESTSLFRDAGSMISSGSTASNPNNFFFLVVTLSCVLAAAIVFNTFPATVFEQPLFPSMTVGLANNLFSGVNKPKSQSIASSRQLLSRKILLDSSKSEILQLTPSRIQCIASLVASKSSLDIFSKQRPKAAVISGSYVKET